MIAGITGRTIEAEGSDPVGIVINIRGTNGAGKTTLAREFLPPNLNGDNQGGPVDLNWYPAPTKTDPARMKRVEGYGNHLHGTSIITVGPYRTATGGLDNIPSFDIQQSSILHALKMLRADAVIAEGVLASTVYGSWGVFASKVNYLGHQFAFCYMQTPLEVCYERIRKRQEASGKVREIKTDLVADKFKAIRSTRLKALAEGHLVYDLPFGEECEAVERIITGSAEAFRAHA